MDENTNRNLVKKLQTFPENVVREEYELVFLKALMESSVGKDLIFKGGTALRLAYNSVRFSEDLDFSIRGAINWEEVKRVLEGVSQDFPAVKKKDMREKYYTYFSLFSIKEDFLAQPFSLKIEISKRPVKWVKNRDFELKSLASPVTPVRASGLVTTMTRAFLDKKKAARERIKGRDLYDLWWLGQQLGKRVVMPNGKFRNERVAAELKRFLPKGNWWLIDELVKQ